MDKKEVARILEEIGTLLELKGENPFKSRAYFNAARVIRTLKEDLAELVHSGRLREVKGIGEALQQKVTELVTTGKCEYHETLRAPYPSGFMEMLQIPGLGARKLKILWEKLGVASTGELEYACRENRLVTLDGFGAKTQEKILNGIEYMKRHHGEYLIPFARKEAEVLLESLRQQKEVGHISLAGSLRRCKETIKNIDIVASSAKPRAVIEYLTHLPSVEKVAAEGNTETSVRLHTGVNVDMRVVSDREYPYALHYFTGSKEHNAALHARAKDMGLKLNQYGLFRAGDLVACKDEREIFAALGLAYIPPELREGRGEIETAERRSLPDLVEQNQIKGLLHVHSTYSDGADSLAEMVRAAADLGYKYIGISDHSKSAFYARGLTEADIERQHREIIELQQGFPQIRILKGIESDILADGSLDYSRETLDSLDFVIGSVHSRFKMNEEEMTARIIRAFENPYMTILGHPTGRLLLTRDGYSINLQKIVDAAVANGVAIEINAQPQRLELDWRLGKCAAEKGALFSINPDAHNTRGLSDITYGVGIARKSWLAARQILNTRDAEGFLEFSLARRSR